MQVRFKRLDPELPIPEYKTPGAVAFDIAVKESVVIPPGEMRMLGTGLVVCVPPGHALIITCRSSSAKKGLTLAHGAGTIDQDYCGPNDELKLPMRNVGSTPYTVEKYERLAQGLIIPALHAELIEVQKLDAPDRGGFGTTG